MKYLYPLMIIIIFLGSCSSLPTEIKQSSASYFTQIPQSIDTPAAMPKAPEGIKSTQLHTPTAIVTSTATKTRTSTFSPTRTPALSPTLSYSDIALCLPKDSLLQTGQVTEIIDGDTIVVRLKDGKLYQVRYIGIDTPEKGMHFFMESAEANRMLVDDKTIVLIKDASETDQYGRLLRYVIAGRTFVNLKLVEDGFAQVATFPPDVACKETFLDVQQTAEQEAIGLWSGAQTPEPTDQKVIILAVNKKEEWVDIQNMGATDVDLAGWNLVSERGNQGCYLSGVIKAGEMLRIWSGAAREGGFGCGYPNPIWNNSEPDPAVLYNAKGVEVSRK